MDAREDGVYITYSTGADTVTKKLGSRIHLPYIHHSGQGNNEAEIQFPLDGQSKLSIEKMTFQNDTQLIIYGDGNSLGKYNNLVTNISIDISGISTLRFYYRGWIDNGYCDFKIYNLIIE